MTPSRRTLPLVGTALALGVWADLTAVYARPGLELPLWIFGALAAGALLARRGLIPLSLRGWTLGAVAVGFTSLLIWRDSEVLAALDFLAVLTCVVLAAPAAMRGALRNLGVADYIAAGARSAGHTVAGMIPIALHDVEWGDRSAARLRPVALVGGGLLVATPVLMLFGSLLGEADPVFRRGLEAISALDLGPVIAHLARIAIAAWLVAGFLRWSVRAPADAPEVAPGMRLDPIVTGTVLAAVALLFLTFVVAEAGYLFGGAAVVRGTGSVTFSHYARDGFFQMVWVTGLSLPLLLLADWSMGDPATVPLRRVRGIAWAVVALLVVMVLSALYRMALYARAYGLTELRFYTTAFMLWLLPVLGWFGMTVLRGRRPRFATGAFLAGLAAIALLDLINPDARIALSLIRRPATTLPVDTAYLSSLSADALPAVAAGLPTLSRPVACDLARREVARWTRDADVHWTVSRALAAGARAQIARQARGCPG